MDCVENQLNQTLIIILNYYYRFAIIITENQ